MSLPASTGILQASSGGIARLTADDICLTAVRMRGLPRLEPMRRARALAATVAAWHDHAFAFRRATVSAIAAECSYSEPLLEASLDALLAPFTEEAMADFAQVMRAADEEAGGRARPVNGGRARQVTGIGQTIGMVMGMVMPGNLPGAGLHEVVIGLLSGRALMLKTSASEPLFFASFARSMAQFDRALAERLAVFNWSRERDDLTTAMRANCDWLAVFGDDDTLEALERTAGREGEEAEPSSAGANMPIGAGFGQRYSGAYVGAGSNENWPDTAAVEGLARDITLFEQAGCLSPQHIFVRDEAFKDGAHGRAYRFAGELAAALEALARVLPPPSQLGLETAASLRRAREAARWRMLGGESVTLWEGENLGWAVIYDERANFTPSPGFRSVIVSPIKEAGNLAERLAPVAGRLEAFAVASASADSAKAKECLGKLGVSYLGAPGRMQSPPLQWRHGGGVFLDAMLQPPPLKDG